MSNKISIKSRIDFENNWNIAQSANPAKGKLAKGEIGVAIVTSDTDNSELVEIIGRIGVETSLTAFDDCPIIFRSPIDFTGPNAQIVKFNEEIIGTEAKVVISNNGEFSTIDVSEFLTNTDVNIPDNIISFNTSTLDSSGFLKWNYDNQSWQFVESFGTIEGPEIIDGGNAESF